MDLSEMTKLEAEQQAQVDIINVNTSAMTAQLVDELINAVHAAMILNKLKPYHHPTVTVFSAVPVCERLTAQQRAEEILLLRRLADALEAEPLGVHCEQIYDLEYSHTVHGGYFYIPRLPSVVDAMIGPAEYAEAESIKVERCEQLTHYVCALGKIGVVLYGEPRAWRRLEIPRHLCDMIAQLNDQRRLSFAQIAAALRDRANRLREVP